MLPRILAFALLWLQVTAAGAAVFGSSLFTGNFRDQQFTGFNPDYRGFVYLVASCLPQARAFSRRRRCQTNLICSSTAWKQ